MRLAELPPLKPAAQSAHHLRVKSDMMIVMVDGSVRSATFCHGCGCTLAEHDKFCGGCGSAIENPGEGSAHAARPPIVHPRVPRFKFERRVGIFLVFGALLLALIGVKVYSAFGIGQDRIRYLTQFRGIDHQLDDLDNVLSRWELQNVIIYDEDTKFKALFDLPSDNLGLMFPSIKPAADQLTHALAALGQLPENTTDSVTRELNGRSSVPIGELGALTEKQDAQRAAALSEYHAAMAEFRSELKQIKNRLGVQ
jgi:hypothetical protein